jgi:MFS family permease
MSMTGDWVLFIALPIYVYNLTHSSLATGLMFMAGTVPRIMFGSIAGIFVDRWDRQRTMVVSDLTRALLLTSLLLVRSPEWVWVIYLVAFAEATISQFFGPAESALLPQLVDKSHLVPANSLNALNNNLARLGGPALGGLLLGLFGFTSVVLMDSISFLLSAIMIALIVQPALAFAENKTSGATEASIPTSQPRLWRDWLAGLRLIFHSRVVSVLFIVMGIAAIAEGVFNVLFVIFIRQILGGDAIEFGWLTSAQAMGGLLGGLIIGWIGTRMRPGRLVSLLAVNGFLVLILIHLPSLPLSTALLVLAGLPIVGYSVGVDTLLQQHVPSDYRGRVFGALATSVAVFVLFGQGLASGLGDQLGIVPTLNIKGILDIVAGLLGFIFLYKISGVQSDPETS